MNNKHYVKSYVGLDLNGQSLKDARIEAIKSDQLPVLTIEDSGRLYFNEDSLKLILWDGYKWVDAESNIDVSVDNHILDITIK